MSYKIEKNIPIPADALTASGRTKYPFADMEIGDSFVVAGKEKMASTVNSAARRLGFKFVSKPERDDEGTVIGVRVWRVEGTTEVAPVDPDKPKRARKRKADAAEVPNAMPEAEVPVPV